MKGLSRPGGEALLTQPKVPRIPVLLYHKIGHPASGVRNPRSYVTPEQFRWQMRFLYRCGYRTISARDLVLHYQGQVQLPNRRILITFDDGSQTCYQNAWPILSEYGFTGLLFLVAGQFGNRAAWDMNPSGVSDDLLKKGQVEEMIRHGFAIGAHSLSHSRLTEISVQEAQREIKESKTVLGNELGCPVDYFAYPYGAYNADHVTFVREAGYHAGFTTRYAESGLFAIYRQNISLTVKPLRFIWCLIRAGRGNFKP